MAVEQYSDLNFNGGAKVTGLPNPTGSADAATKDYVDSAIEGLAWKDSARVSTQANLNLASPGASIDGITMVAGDRVLVRSQTAPAENGLYIWNGAASAATRAPDMSVAAEFEQAVTTVEEGTNAGTTWRQTAVNVTVGTTAIAWTSFGTGSPSASETTAGIAEIATLAETDTGSDDTRTITPLKLATHANRKRKLAQDIGDGSATQYDVTHNFATRDVLVQVRRNSGNFDYIHVDTRALDTNTTRLVFATAPTSNQYRVIVIG